MEPTKARGWEAWFLWWIEHRVVALLLALILVGLGWFVSPVGSDPLDPRRDPVAVDAIPDLGEHQQIVFTTWPGNSPRDIEDQISYPLSSALLGTPGVRSVRSSSALGFSTIYVIFEDHIDFYWARSRLSETLASLPASMLPPGVVPRLGPDATALGQVFWYTLQGQDEQGEATGGWDLDELRRIQDWRLVPALQAVPGVSEVASIGGFVREYQVDVDPLELKAHGVTLTQVANAVRQSNQDIGARTLELNRVEYVVRGIGRLSGIEDILETAVITRGSQPVRIRDVAKVQLGPALRRGALDDAGAPAVGGVVVARYQEDPLEVIAGVKAKIAQLQAGLPSKVLPDGRRSQVKVVPFYDRTQLIEETLDTVSSALHQEFLITVVVIVVMLGCFRAASLVALMLPLGVAGAFVAMKLCGVGANIMALGGIAIAIGTMVDIGIVFVENISRQLREAEPPVRREVVIARAAAQVGPAVLTSVLTTIVSFLPVLGLSSTELRLFSPLVMTKTFAMAAALLLALVLVPCGAMALLRARSGVQEPDAPLRRYYWLLLALGSVMTAMGSQWGIALALGGLLFLCLPKTLRAVEAELFKAFVVLALVLGLTQAWMPLGPSAGFAGNAVFVTLVLGLWLGLLAWFERIYPLLLRFALAHRRRFLLLPALLCGLGLLTWIGVSPLVSQIPDRVAKSAPVQALQRTFPGLGRDYLPSFDEGSFLLMPTTMPHASMRESLEALSQIDAAIAAIPEVDRVVGKIGRAETALDPAPLSMIETLITYRPEYVQGPDGTRVRCWRDEIRSSQDIWEEVLKAAQRPGLTGAPLLMPIGARIVMLQSGMRAPMGIKVQGPDLESLQNFGVELERVLKGVDSLRADTVFAERVVAKPYLEIVLDRPALGRYGLSVAQVQGILQVALGGQSLTELIEGRERYAVRVRYMREARDRVQALEDLLIPVNGQTQVPLSAIASLRYVRGPQVIKSEDAFLTSYLTFDRQPGVSLVDAVHNAQRAIQGEIDAGTLEVPAGVHYAFAGSYQQQVRSEQRLMLLVPLALLVVLLILYIQFRRLSTCLMILSSVAVAVSGGMVLIGCYGQPWFLNLELLGIDLREVFGVRPVNLSVAVWIGFIALVGLATDDGVVMATYLKQRFEAKPVTRKEEIRQRVIEAGQQRVRPCLMTTATTVLALLPVVAAKGRGADLMMPMALPCIGGMAVELITLFVVPLLYCSDQERRYSADAAGGTRMPP